MTDAMTDADVARKLGYRSKVVYESRFAQIVHWQRGLAPAVTELPAFTTDIRATMAEIERRGWLWSKEPATDEPFRLHIYKDDGERRYYAYSDGTPEDDTLALLAALIAAVEATHD